MNRVFYAFKFPDRTLNTSVAHACHALALAVDRWLDRMYSQFRHDDHTRLNLRNLLGLG